MAQQPVKVTKVTQETIDMGRKLSAAGLSNPEAAKALWVGLATYNRMKQSQWDLEKYGEIVRKTGPKPAAQKRLEASPEPESAATVATPATPATDGELGDLVLALQNIYGVLALIEQNTRPEKRRRLFR